MSEFRCPHCGSGDIQKCSVIYNQGTFNGYSTTRIGDVEGKTEEHSSTGLAQSVAPPAEKETNWPIAILAGIFALEALFGSRECHYIIGGILGLVSYGCFSSTFEAIKYNSNVYPIELANWRNSYFCHRCGNVFLMK